VKAARLCAVTGDFKSVTGHNRFSRSSSYGGEPMVSARDRSYNGEPIAY